MTCSSQFQTLLSQSPISSHYKKVLLDFYDVYLEQAHIDTPHAQGLMEQFLLLVIEQVQNPYPFEPYHNAHRSPFDHQGFSCDFIRPLIDVEKSTLNSPEAFEALFDKVSAGENAILFANHQIEADPQALYIGLERFPKLKEKAKDIIFVSGQRVLTDPLAAPLSRGCNLVCIYSKKHMDSPAEEKARKQAHNHKAMAILTQELGSGGKVVFVAPSGGRDRPDENGTLIPAPFDEEAIAHFCLIAKRAKKHSSFYPLALSTYGLMPPPAMREKSLGERRSVAFCPVHIALGNALDFDSLKAADKHTQRTFQASLAYAAVKGLYAAFFPK